MERTRTFDLARTHNNQYLTECVHHQIEMGGVLCAVGYVRATVNFTLCVNDSLRRRVYEKMHQLAIGNNNYKYCTLIKMKI
jgi:hypothetical protein